MFKWCKLNKDYDSRIGEWMITSLDAPLGKKKKTLVWIFFVNIRYYRPWSILKELKNINQQIQVGVKSATLEIRNEMRCSEMIIKQLVFKMLNSFRVLCIYFNHKYFEAMGHVWFSFFFFFRPVRAEGQKILPFGNPTRPCFIKLPCFFFFFHSFSFDD